MIEYKKFEPFIGEPDKERLRAAIKMEPVDRVPNLDNLIEDKHVEKILGRYAGNTLAYGGDPAKGAGHEAVRPMYPDDFVDLCNVIGQDIIIFDAGIWTPFKKNSEDGNLIQVSDKSIKNLEAKYQGKGYGDFKKDLAEVVAEFLTKFQKKFNSFSDDEVKEILKAGAKKVKPIAEETLRKVKEKIGVL